MVAKNEPDYGKYQIGDCYRDLMNRDILKILGFSDDRIFEDQPGATARYAKCAVFVLGAAPVFGVQEMRLTHFENAGRWQKLTGLGGWWWRFVNRNQKVETK